MNRLKQLRSERNMTQEELARELHTSQQRLSKIERELISMNEELIGECVRYFGVTADYLLGISDVEMDMEVKVTESYYSNLTDPKVQGILRTYESFNGVQRELLRGMAKVIAEQYHPEDFEDEL